MRASFIWEKCEYDDPDSQRKTASSEEKATARFAKRIACGRAGCVSAGKNRNLSQAGSDVFNVVWGNSD
jgi:hypothetical protein